MQKEQIMNYWQSWDRGPRTIGGSTDQVHNSGPQLGGPHYVL